LGYLGGYWISVKALIKMNAIKNCPVTTEDVNNAKKIFGTDKSSLRGKSTRRKSTTLVREDRGNVRQQSDTSPSSELDCPMVKDKVREDK
jgi:hypothetical protein